MQMLSAVAAGIMPRGHGNACPDVKEPKQPRRVRCQDRAAQWRRDIEAKFGYLLSLASTREQRDQLETEYQAAIERGPDFARVRREAKTFGLPASGRGLDRNMLAKLVWQFEQIERGLWKIDRKHARDRGKKITRTMPASVLPVLRALVRLTVKYGGKVHPSYEGLAILAQVSRSTAIAAVKLLEQWGLMAVTRRCKREQTAAGPRLVQDTNAYELHHPQGLSAMAAQVFGVRGSESKDPPASSNHKTSANKEVQVASTVPANTQSNPLPPAFQTPRRRINWWEMIRR